MGILSSSVSITRYKVEGELQKPVLETVCSGFKKNCINEIENKSSDKSVGWACFDNPFVGNFHRSSFLIGTNIVVSLRIDKKTIPAKVVEKEYAIEANKRLKKSGRDFLSKQEKKDIKDNIVHSLNLKIPSIPNIYDVVWQYEEKTLLFFSSMKNPIEELESLFYKTFSIRLINLFPFTMSLFKSNLSDAEKNILINLSPTCFTE